MLIFNHYIYHKESDFQDHKHFNLRDLLFAFSINVMDLYDFMITHQVLKFHHF